jgi:hypothetical protein
MSKLLNSPFPSTLKLARGLVHVLRAACSSQQAASETLPPCLGERANGSSTCDSRYADSRPVTVCLWAPMGTLAKDVWSAL